jgi:hypothetical protein
MNDGEKCAAQVLREAGQLAADAEARIAGIRTQISQLEREGRDASAARDALETLVARLALLKRQSGVVLQLLEMAKRQKGNRRAAGARQPAPNGRRRPLDRGGSSH